MNNANEIIGWDVGGAHLKIALIKNQKLCMVKQFYTPVWKGIEHLEKALNTVLASIPEHAHHAVTMTAELTDIFSDRASGVDQILNCLNQYLNGPLQLFAGSKGLIDTDNWRPHAMDIASSNWQATVQYVTQYLQQGLLCDMGSSTTDIIPFTAHQCCAKGATDRTRMQYGELQYSGLLRTPVMSVVTDVPINNTWQSIAAEHFATMADVYRLTDDMIDAPDITDTADHREKSTAASAQRLARMLGTDAQEYPLEVWKKVASFIAKTQQKKIADNLIQKLVDHPTCKQGKLVGAGIGAPIIAKIAQYLPLDYCDFSELITCNKSLKRDVTSHASAVALAHLVKIH